MRQVPLKSKPSKGFSCYGLIGSGQVALHLAHYLDLLDIPFVTWSRRSNRLLSQVLKHCSHVLILIKDSAIEPFIIQNKQLLASKALIHCSGSLSTSLAIGAHPLMTFSKQLYDEKTYRKIHFVVDSQEHSFESILPYLPNDHSIISPSQKAKYHALCVMSGNFSSMLWQVFFAQLEENFKISKSHALIYLQQTFKNITVLEDGLTGPLQRGDKETIELNLKALESNQPLYDTYKAFIKLKDLL